MFPILLLTLGNCNYIRMYVHTCSGMQKYCNSSCSTHYTSTQEHTFCSSLVVEGASGSVFWSTGLDSSVITAVSSCFCSCSFCSSSCCCCCCCCCCCSELFVAAVFDSSSPSFSAGEVTPWSFSSDCTSFPKQQQQQQQ